MKACKVTWPGAKARHHPTPIFGVRDGRVRRNCLTRVATSLAQHRRTSHDPRHQIDFGAFGHGFMDGAVELLTPARAVAVHQCGDDRHGELFACDVIGVPHLWCDRR